MTQEGLFSNLFWPFITEHVTLWIVIAMICHSVRIYIPKCGEHPKTMNWIVDASKRDTVQTKFCTYFGWLLRTFTWGPSHSNSGDPPWNWVKVFFQTFVGVNVIVTTKPFKVAPFLTDWVNYKQMKQATSSLHPPPFLKTWWHGIC